MRQRGDLGRLERLLCATGLICLGTALAIVAEGQIYQLLGRWQLGTVDRAEALAEHPRAASVLLGDELGTIEDQPPAPGTPLGTIAIPEAGLDVVVLEGVGADVLRRGVGHFPQTPMPGAGGNFALAGHRDTFFRSLRHVKPGQRVTLTTADGRELVYRVTGTLDLLPTDPEARRRMSRSLESLLTAIFRGSLLCALAQGLLGAVGWWIAGLPSPALAGVARRAARRARARRACLGRLASRGAGPQDHPGRRLRSFYPAPAWPLVR